jgi:hypothetical protein
MTAGRLGAALGLPPAAALGAWWLAVQRLGGGPAALSVAALHALWLCQMLVIVLFGARLGVSLGRRTAASGLFAAIALAWPLTAAIGSATYLGARALLLPQAALIGAAWALPAVGAAVAGEAHGGRWRNAAPTAIALASVLSAALLWWARARWLAWLT